MLEGTHPPCRKCHAKRPVSSADLLRRRDTQKEAEDAAKRESCDNSTARSMEKAAQDITLGQAVLRDGIGMSAQTLTVSQLRRRNDSCPAAASSYSANQATVLQAVTTHLESIGRITLNRKMASPA